MQVELPIFVHGGMEDIFSLLGPPNMSQVVEGVSYIMSLFIMQDSVLDMHWVLPTRVVNSTLSYFCIYS